MLLATIPVNYNFSKDSFAAVNITKTSDMNDSKVRVQGHVFPGIKSAFKIATLHSLTFDFYQSDNFC